MFELTFPVRFDDVDAAGLVYYPRLLDYCHVGLEDFFTAVLRIWIGDKPVDAGLKKGMLGG